MCAFSLLVNVRFAISSIHWLVWASSPSRLRSSCSNLRSSASRSTTGNVRLSFMLSTFMALPFALMGRRPPSCPPRSLFGRVGVDLHRDDPVTVRFLPAELNEALRSLANVARFERHRGHRRFVVADAFADLRHLLVERRIALLTS